jgi:hypothetical protein
MPGKSARSGSSERLHCRFTAWKLDEYHSLYNALRLFFTSLRTPASPVSPALHKVADPLKESKAWLASHMHSKHGHEEHHPLFL